MTAHSATKGKGKERNSRAGQGRLKHARFKHTHGHARTDVYLSFRRFAPVLCGSVSSVQQANVTFFFRFLLTFAKQDLNISHTHTHMQKNNQLKLSPKRARACVQFAHLYTHALTHSHTGLAEPVTVCARA